MSFTLGTTTIQKNVTSTFKTPFTGLKAIIITNLSGLSCRVNMIGGNVTKTLHPGMSDWFDVKPGYSGTIDLTPIIVVSNPTSYAGNTLTFDAIGASDNEQNTMYPVQLNIPAVTTTASGKPVFTADVRNTATATLVQHLNVFNPSNSNVNCIFHSARVFLSAGTAPNQASISSAPAPDFNLGTAVGAATHIRANTFPTSVTHCTYEDAATVRSISIVEGAIVPINTLYEFLAFPDTLTLGPGNQMYLALASGGVTGAASLLSLKWTEDQIV